jgi:hypothetical protein
MDELAPMTKPINMNATTERSTPMREDIRFERAGAKYQPFLRKVDTI